MFEKLKEDAKVNNYRITPIFILFIYRIGNEIYYSKINKVIKKIILIFIKVFQKIFIDIVFGIEINYESTIGKGMRIVHPKEIIIASSAKVGEYCTIFNGVTVGINEHSEKSLAVTIGNNVYIGTGGKIIGQIIIGDNCKIGANAVVFKNIKKNTTVVSEQRIIEKS
ncbi:serine O-acetyltransferase [Clostridium sardiniense]|uniref:serine O-acetyltransferase n=1 Tax=Clostridium sardiniense TaxID=29369 RepID=UPI00195AC819|nr:serine O-acetyltransferase [Clostridium sardiniense]MBM7833061.1 serine O-acetyltransferase [Clostridium sardiniense]